MALRDLDIGKLQALDGTEWERLQAEYHDRVFGYVKRQVNDAELASDLAQETFLGAVRGIGNFDSRYNIEQFLMGIARNKVIDHLRRRRPEVNVSDGDDESTGFFGAMPGDGEPAPRILEAREKITRQKGVLISCLQEMARELWDRREFKKLMAIEACFLKPWSHRKIADRIGIADEKSIAGVKFRAIRDLQARLRRRDPRKTLFSGLWESV